MSTPATQLQSGVEPKRQIWSPGTRVGFRFCFVYFTLYCLSNQIVTGLLPISIIEIPDPATKWPMRQIVTWVAIHVFHVKTELVYFSGSGDKTFDWVLVFCLLVFSVFATIVWSLLDRKHEQYAALYKWFRLFIRFCLVGQMFGYGLAKAIPLQMPFPSLARLVEPYGNFSLMGVLWASIGASRAYEIFAGVAETLGGILLIFPRTMTLGALVCLLDMVQVFMLNMTYDVPVKLFSFHLILMSLLLLVPDFRRLADFFLLDRAADPPSHPSLFRTPRGNRIALAAQIVFGFLLLGMNAYGSWTARAQYGEAQEKSALYGIWNITDMTVDGQSRVPLLTDNGRWRRAIFELPTRMVFQRMDDTLERYSCHVDVKGGSLELTKDEDKNWKASFVFQRPTPEQLILDGEMDSHKLHMQLQLFDRQKFLLVSRGFHWIQEYPFNR